MEVSCEFKRTQLPSIYGYGLCVTSVNITQSNTRITSFKGSHEFGKTNGDVTWLHFEDTVVEYFPKGLSEHFPDLIGLQITNCKLKEISRQDLVGLEDLQRLSITNCLLRTLPDDLFVDMTKLDQVDLSWNIIELSSSQFLKPFIDRNIVSFTLKNNTNIDAYLGIFGYGFGKCDSIADLMKTIDDKLVNRECLKCKSIETKFDFSSKIRSLWPSGRFSDFELIVGEKRFRVHKFVLGLQSSFFAKVFDDNDKTNAMTIKAFSETAVENILKFMYTSELNEAKETDNGMEMEMFSIAFKLNIFELKEIYEKILKENLKTCNELAAYEIFLLAHQNCCEELKQQAFKVIEKQFARNLSPNLLNKPELLKHLIDKKLEFEKMMNSC